MTTPHHELSAATSLVRSGGLKIVIEFNISEFLKSVVNMLHSILRVINNSFAHYPQKDGFAGPKRFCWRAINEQFTTL